MVGKVGKRVKILAAWFRGEGPAREVPLTEALHSAFQIYGLKKGLLKRRANIVSVGDLCRFNLDGRTVFWPGQADVDRLVDMYFEVNCANAHRFDCPPTPVAPGAVVFDIGCCEGFFSMRALEQGAGRVYCFEPGRAACNALEKTFEKQTGEGRIEVVNKLLGDAPGELSFRENPADPSIGFVIPETAVPDDNDYIVPVVTLDSFVAEKGLECVDFLKIDVEGYELEVLRGGANMIERFGPMIAIAAYHCPEHVIAIKQLLSEFNPCYRFEAKGLVEFDNVVRPILLHCYAQTAQGR
jgi:FkbM family methyltransferase